MFQARQYHPERPHQRSPLSGKSRARLRSDKATCSSFLLAFSSREPVPISLENALAREPFRDALDRIRARVVIGAGGHATRSIGREGNSETLAGLKIVVVEEVMRALILDDHRARRAPTCPSHHL